MKKNKFFVVLFIFLFLISFVQSTAYGSVLKEEDYSISRSEINREISEGSVFRDYVEITNFGSFTKKLSLDYRTKDQKTVFNLENNFLNLPPKSSSKVYFLIKAEELGTYGGFLSISGDINYEMPVNISVVDHEINSPFLFKTDVLKKSFNLDKKIEIYLKLNKLEKKEIENVSFSFYLINPEENDSLLLGEEYRNVSYSFQEIKSFNIPNEIQEGEYVLETFLTFENFILSDKVSFSLELPFIKRKLFGFVKFGTLIFILSLIGVGFLIYFLIKRNIKKKKRYQMKLDSNTIPKKNGDFFNLGKVAESKHLAYLDPSRLTTHAIVAGATGGGKSISAQVIVEEALRHNVSVVVFDPTAQWSGMLRKCTDKKMISYYPKFGLKERDAMAFKGNVRQVQNARQLIDIQKYLNPGQIQIFSLNKLNPKDMDIFVANVIRQIFKSDPKEYPNLKTLIVFDEVHRLLPKFGGSGQGFLQIERACREFRKWGLGVLLISQVLNDFVGEIKANISTEVQMRTRDEGDLNRIKTKYGETFLQSLVKASVGVGMFVNPAYNHAKPYFVNFRPILHSTRRLPDEELEKYNNYNDQVDDLEFNIEQLEREKVDTFDLKMELKLIKDKIMSGSFSVVEIYLEGLKPRVAKEFEKIGKTPKKREINLVSEEEILASIEEAKKEREEVEKKEEKIEDKKEKEEEKIEDKQVAPLTFDNGIMIGSIKELKEYLPNMEEEFFKIHVNDKRNDIFSWISENFKEQSKDFEGILERDEIVKKLEFFGKNKEKSPEDKKEGENKDFKEEKSNYYETGRKKKSKRKE